MNEVSTLSNAVAVSDGKVTTTSLKIAEVFGKLHKDVLKVIESLQVPDNFRERNFAPSEYTAQNGIGKTIKYPMYNITRDGFTLLVMGFTGAAAMQFKIAYLEEFNRMEAELRRMQTGASSVPSVSVRESPCPPPVQPEPYFVPEKSILRDLTLQFVNLIILSKDTILLRHLIRRMERSLEFRTERTGIFQWEIPRGLLRHFPGGCPFSPS